MKKIKNLIVWLALVGLSVSVNAQTMIIVQKADGTNPRVFNDLATAVAAAASGEYIYLGSGTHEVNSPLTITKPLHFVGSGYEVSNADLTTIIKFDYSATPLTFSQTASGFTMTGVRLESTDVELDNISNSTISRCYIGGKIHLYSVSNTTISHCDIPAFYPSIYLYDTNTNIVITECYMAGGVYGSNFYCPSSSCIISKCNISVTAYSGIGTAIDGLKNTIVSNNIIYGKINGDYLTVENNIFLRYGFNTSNSTFRNNVSEGPLDITGSNVSENNIVADYGQYSYSNMFVRYGSYSLPNDYHLVPSFPGKNAGTDGTDVGIYGTSQPYSDNPATAYPQILKKVIGTETDADGKLKVDIKVEAQDN